jgi:CRP-like cAMP-binding protein
MCDEEVVGQEHLPEEIKKQPMAGSTLRALKPLTDYLIDVKLTAAEYRLYFYLLKLDPADPDYRELMEPKAIMERIGISKETFYTAIARLKELGLYHFKSRASQPVGKPGEWRRSEFSD